MKMRFIKGLITGGIVGAAVAMRVMPQLRNNTANQSNTNPDYFNDADIVIDDKMV